MIINKCSGLEFYQFSSLELPGLTQAVFSRHGGSSPTPWKSLNLGGTVGDDPSRVAENLARLVGCVGYRTGDLVQVRQIHSAEVILANEPMDAIKQGDAIITNTTGLLLLMRFADCVPILLVDRVKKAVGIAHAGWQGTVKEVSYHAVRAMQTHFGSDPSQISAGIGPSIGPDHYYVQDDVIARVKQAFPQQFDAIITQDADGVKLDLWKANMFSLQRAGVEDIEVSRICTACHPRHWFSHRGEQGKTGRFGAVIGIK